MEEVFGQKKNASKERNEQRAASGNDEHGGSRGRNADISNSGHRSSSNKETTSKAGGAENATNALRRRSPEAKSKAVARTTRQEPTGSSGRSQTKPGQHSDRDSDKDWEPGAVNKKGAKPAPSIVDTATGMYLGPDGRYLCRFCPGTSIKLPGYVTRHLSTEKHISNAAAAQPKLPVAMGAAKQQRSEEKSAARSKSDTRRNRSGSRDSEQSISPVERGKSRHGSQAHSQAQKPKAGGKIARKVTERRLSTSSPDEAPLKPRRKEVATADRREVAKKSEKEKTTLKDKVGSVPVRVEKLPQKTQKKAKEGNKAKPTAELEV